MFHRPAGEPKGVLIYGVGNVGKKVARLSADYGWPVIAVNRSGEKVGRDLGVLTGVDTLRGSIVTDSASTDYASIWADVAVVAIHDRLENTFPHHRKLLEAGLNVICVGAESSYPSDIDPKVANEINSVAQANGVTFTGCGLWDTYRIWSIKTLTGPCTSIRGLRHCSVTDVNRFGGEVAKLVRIGDNPKSFNQGKSMDRSIYRVFLVQVVKSLGFTITHVEEHQEPVTLKVPVYCKSLERDIEPGLCAGMRTIIRVKTKEGLSATAEIDLRLTAGEEGEWMSWGVDGTPPVELRLSGLDTGHATASSVVNRIPDILSSPPGLVTVDQLSPMQFQGQRLLAKVG